MLTGKADVVKEYVGWAIAKGYAVIDVNIPKHATTEPVSFSPLFVLIFANPSGIWKI